LTIKQFGGKGEGREIMQGAHVTQKDIIPVTIGRTKEAA